MNTNVGEFFLVRDVDATGISGTGKVAQGFVFQDGTAALRWLTHTGSTGFYTSVEDLEKIHGHGGATRLVFINEPSVLDSPQEPCVEVTPVVNGTWTIVFPEHEALGVQTLMEAGLLVIRGLAEEINYNGKDYYLHHHPEVYGVHGVVSLAKVTGACGVAIYQTESRSVLDTPKFALLFDCN
jgi:hypothetical protein